MQIKTIDQLSNIELDGILLRLPFFRGVKQRSQAQFKELMHCCRLVEMDSNEVILRRGDKSTWLYFLLRGELLVYPGLQAGESSIGQVLPGEMFGDLALIGNSERQATVCSADSGGGIALFACDASCFGRLEDDYPISQETKLAFYRMMTDSVRWKLEKHRMACPEHPLVAKIIALPLYRGARGGLQELQALVEQVLALAEILIAWNSDTQPAYLGGRPQLGEP
ncbi:cyclic nucleotide-binding protein [Sinobacterium caligoides]|uniref:Cyclic nucleotide-binding protein n=1 Tax=Sinobacterium caligoides TaxID=933926 RepID=A0A3N2D4L2_9GAMM|nr:cyclic nucleotide-binding domain-containing protein [Sinobacterium caligoides]ROR94737.1 cyclic nucleotide-binding protein [Sinobacterium caligoides]